MPSPPLFDGALRRLRRDRAARHAEAPFLWQRAFDELVDGLASEDRSFEHALLIGCPSPSWPERLLHFAARVTVVEPGPLYSTRLSIPLSDDGDFKLEPGNHDLILSIGTLDTIEALPTQLLRLRFALAPGGLFLAALPGAGSLALLREAMLAADEAQRRGAGARIHPGIDAQSCAQMLQEIGFEDVVIDVDTVRLGYEDLLGLVGDLRRHGATNLLNRRPRTSVDRRGLEAARRTFASHRVHGRSYETLQILYLRARGPVETLLTPSPYRLTRD